MSNMTLGAVDQAGQRDPLAPRPRAGHFHAVDRWELLGIVRDLRRELGIGDREIAVLGAHLAVLPKGPVSASDLLMSYAKVSGLLGRANGMDERRFRRGEARLEEVGLIHRRLSANGRRFPQRNASDEVVDAYGIDMRPLFLQAQNLRQWLRKRQEEQTRRTAFATRISSRIREHQRRIEKIFGSVPGDLLEFARYALTITRRKTATIQELSALEGQVDQIASKLDESRAGAMDHEEIGSDDTTTNEFASAQNLESSFDGPAERAEDSTSSLTNYPAPSSHSSRGPHLPTTPSRDLPRQSVSAPSPEERLGSSQGADKMTPDAGQIDRRKESHSKESYSLPRSKQETDPISIWHECCELSSMYPAPPRSLHDLSRIIREFSGFLGLGLDQVERALPVLGVARMMMVLDYLASRIHKISQPRAYLSSMIKRYQTGGIIAGGRVRPGSQRDPARPC